MTTGVHDGGRVAAVRATGLLDGKGMHELDRIIRLATGALGVPVSLVSLVDDDRQVFAAQTGLHEPWAAAGETPLSHSFCQHVVATNAPLVVDDARDHALVADNLAVRDIGVLAYAGVPVHDEHGQPLGSLCAIDGHPRGWTDDDLATLADLAVLVSSAIELQGHRRGDPLQDWLTGLPARSLLAELTARAIDTAARSEGTTAVIAIGLDGFRLVNDALGHAAGDRLLVAVANRLSGSVRPGDTVSRLAGDEFLVLCDSVEDEADASAIQQRLLRAIANEPYVIDGVVQPATATAGLATTGSMVTPDELIAGACAAMQRAKEDSDDAIERVADIGQTRAGARLRLRNAVAQAHLRGEMSLVYQPLVRMSTGRVTGYEALLRWEHPEYGPISPDAFIPAAEQSGAIVPIGEWVLAQATADLAAWRRQAPAHDLHVAVNVAPAQIAVPTFPSTVAAALLEAGVPPAALTLEVTERTLLADRAAHRASLAELRELGVRLSLDDFGTGFSALGYLTKFPLDDLKIDRIFINELPFNPQTAAIVDGIVAMARALGLRTVAEGIERPDQLTMLQRLGCDVGQGYHLGRPVAADAVSASLAAPRTRAVA